MGEHAEQVMYIQERHAEVRKMVDKFGKQQERTKAMLWAAVILQLRCSQHVNTCESRFTCQSLGGWRHCHLCRDPFRMQ